MPETNKYAVLIFEDDQDLVNQWSKTFKQNGLDVRHAKSVDEATILCNQLEFDAVILDICILDDEGDLINRGGFTLLTYLRNTALKKIPQWAATVPVLVVTGYSSKHKMGFDPLFSAKVLGGQHLTETFRKPFTPYQLFDEVIKLITKHNEIKKAIANKT